MRGKIKTRSNLLIWKSTFIHFSDEWRFPIMCPDFENNHDRFFSKILSPSLCSSTWYNEHISTFFFFFWWCRSILTLDISLFCAFYGDALKVVYSINKHLPSSNSELGTGIVVVTERVNPCLPGTDILLAVEMFRVA